MKLNRASAALAALLWATGALAQQQPMGVSAGRIVEVCVTPTVTTGNAYGTNYVVGGLLTFAGALPSSGGGAIQSVYVQTNTVESMGFTFTPFSANPTATTWTDAAVAAISGADKKLVRGTLALSGSSILGTHTTAFSTGGGAVVNGGPVAAGSTQTLYGVLTANGALTNNFATATDLTVCVDVLQFP